MEETDRIVKPPLAGTCVLLVDDDADNVDLLDFVMTEVGASVRTARTGADALALVRDWKPAIVLLDVWMPQMDGYEPLGKIRTLPGLQAVPAIAVTACASAEDRRRAVEGGFDRHVAKPVDTNAPVGLVSQLAAARA